METNRLPVCIYHDQCPDGFGALVIAKKFLEHIIAIPGKHGTPLTDDELEQCRDADVYYLDFCSRLDDFWKVHERAKSVTILDHHESARERMFEITEQNTPKLRKQFNMNHSGAMLSWLHFSGKSEFLAPPYIKVIEDNDMYWHHLHGSREMFAAITSYDMTFDSWFCFEFMDFENFRNEGTPIVRYIDKTLSEILPGCTRIVPLFGHLVQVANVPYVFASRACEILYKNEPFAASFYINQNSDYAFSLRSDPKTGIDVREFAERAGGGGHKHSSGFLLNAREARKLEQSFQQYYWNEEQMWKSTT